MTYEISIDGTNYRLELHQERRVAGPAASTAGQIEVDAVIARPNVFSVILAGHKAYEVECERTAIDLHFWVKSARFAVARRAILARSRSGQNGPARTTVRRSYSLPCPAIWFGFLFAAGSRGRGRLRHCNGHRGDEDAERV